MTVRAEEKKCERAESGGLEQTRSAANGSFVHSRPHGFPYFSSHSFGLPQQSDRRFHELFSSADHIHNEADVLVLVLFPYPHFFPKSV